MQTGKHTHTHTYTHKRATTRLIANSAFISGGYALCGHLLMPAYRLLKIKKYALQISKA
jgi:hypothetical protein